MGAVMNSTTLASETNEPTKWIEMKEIPKLQMCQYCHMTIHNDEVDGIMPRRDSNNNIVYDIKRLKISCRGCEQKSKEQVVGQNQRQSNQQNKRHEYARQTSRGS